MCQFFNNTKFKQNYDFISDIKYKTARFYIHEYIANNVYFFINTIKNAKNYKNYLNLFSND